MERLFFQIFTKTALLYRTGVKDIQLKAFDDLKVEIAPPLPPFVWLRWFNDSGMFGLENTSRELSVWYNEQLAEK